MNEYALKEKGMESIQHLQFQVHYCNHDVHPYGWKLPKRILPDAELIFIKSGSGVFTIGGETYTGTKNDMFYIPPYVENSVRSTDENFEFYCIHFDVFVNFRDHELKGDVESYEHEMEFVKVSLNYENKCVLSDPVVIHSLMSQTFQETCDNFPGGNIIAESNLMQIWVHLFRSIEGNHNKNDKINWYILQIKQYVQVNYMNRITLSDVANHINLQPSYVSNLFKKETKITFLKYVNTYRVNIAKSYLVNTNYKLSYIAEIVGFYDWHHFSYVFKKFVGMSPGQFRKLYQESRKEKLL